MGKSVTALRIENFAAAVATRKQRLKEALKVYGKAFELDHRESLEFWGELRRLSVMPYRHTLLWRIATKPTNGAEARRRHQALHAGRGPLRLVGRPRLAGGAGHRRRRNGRDPPRHRYPRRPCYAHPRRAGVRASVEVFQPLSPAVERLTRGLKAAFDPAGVLNPGRMYANV